MPRRPFSLMKRSRFGFVRRHPIGPWNHLLRLLVTQSSSLAIPIMPPVSNSFGNLVPRALAYVPSATTSGTVSAMRWIPCLLAPG